MDTRARARKLRWPLHTNIYRCTAGRAQTVATTGSGGQIYLLTADRGRNRAQINRFAIANRADEPIDDMTVQPFPDIFIKEIPSYFVNLSEYRNLFVTDGVLNFHACSFEDPQLPTLKILPVSLEIDIRSGFRFLEYGA